MRVRTVLSILVLLAAAAFVVVKVVDRVGGDSGDAPAASGARTAEGEGECKVLAHDGSMGIEIATARPDCAEAQRLFARYEALVKAGASGYELTPVADGWRCTEYPFSEYPLMGSCERGGLRFKVFGLAPSAHLPPP